MSLTCSRPSYQSTLAPPRWPESQIAATLSELGRHADRARSALTTGAEHRAVGALALAVGPLLGGLISQHVSWGWIFFINVPVGVATLALGMWAISESREDQAPRRLDLPGVALSAGALFALTYALIEGHAQGWTSSLILGSFAVAAALGIAFVGRERGTSEPMVAVSLFRERVSELLT